jgi:hypothetical protein
MIIPLSTLREIGALLFNRKGAKFTEILFFSLNYDEMIIPLSTLREIGALLFNRKGAKFAENTFQPIMFYGTLSKIAKPCVPNSLYL